MTKERAKHEKMYRSIRSMWLLQGEPGQYDTSEYTVGMYNGLEMAMSVLEARLPEFIDPKIIKHVESAEKIMDEIEEKGNVEPA